MCCFYRVQVARGKKQINVLNHHSVGDWADNDFQQFSNGYSLTDQNYYSLSSDATILLPQKRPAIGEPMKVVYVA